MSLFIHVYTSKTRYLYILYILYTTHYIYIPRSPSLISWPASTRFRCWNFGVDISSWRRTGCIVGGCVFLVIFQSPIALALVHLYRKIMKNNDIYIIVYIYIYLYFLFLYLFIYIYTHTHTFLLVLSKDPGKFWRSRLRLWMDVFCFGIPDPDPFAHILAGGFCTPEKKPKICKTPWLEMDQHSNRLDHMQALHEAPNPLTENPYPTTPKKTAAGPKTARSCCTMFRRFFLKCFERPA